MTSRFAKLSGASGLIRSPFTKPSAISSQLKLATRPCTRLRFRKEIAVRVRKSHKLQIFSQIESGAARLAKRVPSVATDHNAAVGPHHRSFSQDQRSLLVRRPRAPWPIPRRKLRRRRLNIVEKATGASLDRKSTRLNSSHVK